MSILFQPLGKTLLSLIRPANAVPTSVFSGFPEIPYGAGPVVGPQQRPDSAFVNQNRTVTTVGPTLDTDRNHTTPAADPIQSEHTLAFPTDSKVREKENNKLMKARGEDIVVKKLKKHVEEHYDDCG